MSVAGSIPPVTIARMVAPFLLLTLWTHPFRTIADISGRASAVFVGD